MNTMHLMLMTSFIPFEEESSTQLELYNHLSSKSTGCMKGPGLQVHSNYYIRRCTPWQEQEVLVGQHSRKAESKLVSAII